MTLNAAGNGIDWKATEARALGMTDAELFYAGRDAADAGRQLGGDAEGFYSDESSVYAGELRARRTMTQAKLDRRAAAIAAAVA